MKQGVSPLYFKGTTANMEITFDLTTKPNDQINKANDRKRANTKLVSTHTSLLCSFSFFMENTVLNQMATQNICTVH
jgi:hypothetical protein